MKKLAIFAALMLVTYAGWLVAQQPVSVQNITAALAAGGNTIGAVTQASGPWAMNLTQVNSTGLASPTGYGTAPSGNVIGVNAYVTNPITASFGPSSSSAAAASAYHGVSSTSTYNTVKGSSGNLYGLQVFNPSTSPCYVVFYNSASPTIGTTTEIYAIGVQAGVTVQLPPSAVAMANFATAITYATTTTDGGSSVCGTGLSVNIQYL